MKNGRKFAFALLAVSLFVSFISGQVALSQASSSPLQDGVYHNDEFGFSYKIPEGWAVKNMDAARPDGSAKTLLLLFPKQTTTAIFVIAEKLPADFHGTAADYLRDRSQRRMKAVQASAQGNQAPAQRVKVKVLRQPEDVTFSGHKLTEMEWREEVSPNVGPGSVSTQHTDSVVLAFAMIQGEKALRFECMSPEKDSKNMLQQFEQSMKDLSFRETAGD
jgi:hypothetical protein